MKIAIAYFTYEGENNWSGDSSDRSASSTRTMAEYVQKAVGGDLIPIEPAEAYPADYESTLARARAEAEQDARPALVDTPDLSAYDVVFLGFPSWMGTMPRPVWTLLETADLANKLVAPFCTNEGSGMARAESDIAALAPAARRARGLALEGKSVPRSEARVAEWAQKVVAQA